PALGSRPQDFSSLTNSVLASLRNWGPDLEARESVHGFVHGALRVYADDRSSPKVADYLERARRSLDDSELLAGGIRVYLNRYIDASNEPIAAGQQSVQKQAAVAALGELFKDGHFADASPQEVRFWMRLLYRFIYLHTAQTLKDNAVLKSDPLFDAIDALLADQSQQQPLPLFASQARPDWRALMREMLQKSSLEITYGARLAKAEVKPALSRDPRYLLNNPLVRAAFLASTRQIETADRMAAYRTEMFLANHPYLDLFQKWAAADDNELLQRADHYLKTSGDIPRHDPGGYYSPAVYTSHFHDGPLPLRLAWLGSIVDSNNFIEIYAPGSAFFVTAQDVLRHHLKSEDMGGFLKLQYEMQAVMYLATAVLASRLERGQEALLREKDIDGMFRFVEFSAVRTHYSSSPEPWQIDEEAWSKIAQRLLYAAGVCFPLDNSSKIETFANFTRLINRLSSAYPVFAKALQNVLDPSAAKLDATHFPNGALEALKGKFVGARLSDRPASARAWLEDYRAMLDRRQDISEISDNFLQRLERGEAPADFADRFFVQRLPYGNFVFPNTNLTFDADAYRPQTGEGRQAEEILWDMIRPLAEGRDHLVIGLAGPAGSGKTTLAHKLAALIQGQGISAGVLSGDSYLLPSQTRRR
ncbi:MAG: hypothetical protein WCG06_05415, partial [Candidatus Omnitrophota bacterium]